MKKDFIRSIKWHIGEEYFTDALSFFWIVHRYLSRACKWSRRAGLAFV